MVQNLVALTGRCVTAPVIKQHDRTIYCKYRIKIARPYTSHDDFFTVLSFGKKAKDIARMLQQGQLHTVQGILRSGEYIDQVTGRKVRTVTIIAEKLSVYERDLYRPRTIEDVARELSASNGKELFENLTEGLELMDEGEREFGTKSIERSVKDMEVEVGDPDIPR